MLQSQDQALRHMVQLAPLSKTTATVAVQALAPAPVLAQQWLDRFSAVLEAADPAQLQTVVHPEGWWRDHLALSWDLRTLQTLPNIITFASEPQRGGKNLLAEAQLHGLRLAADGKFVPQEKAPVDGLEWVESMFYFSTRYGQGKGMLRLAKGNDGTWKAHMLYTALQEMTGHEELVGRRRPHGGNNSLLGGAIAGNWQDRRDRQKEFLDDEPTVVVIGAGQSGLSIGARLQALGISCLLVDRNKRIGDNWRNRYRTLVTHDPVQYTHMAYLPFPPNWPLFTPKDKLGDWFEAYASLMELNVWMSTTVEKAEFSDKDLSWTVDVARADGTKRSLQPRHVVFCTGHAGEPKVPTFPGQDTFEGVVYHGSQHQDASATGSMTGKKVVVVGTGNSGHDISQNYYENGAEVSMIQRRGTYVISAAKGLFMMHEGLYDETGPPTEDADIYGQSLPIPVQFALNVAGTTRIAEAEKENLDGLAKAGFSLHMGDDKSGIYRLYVTRGGGYYIDVGASKLIIEGKIKVIQSPDGIQGFTKNELVLADGRKLEADVVVLATGYDNMRTSVEKAIGKKEADRCKDVWDLDNEGEVNAMWRPSGHPRLWFMGGSLALCRIYSRFLAMQIKAVEEGINGV